MGGEVRRLFGEASWDAVRGVLGQPPQQSLSEMRWKLQQGLEI